jgi:hypothetical protein
MTASNERPDLPPADQAEGTAPPEPPPVGTAPLPVGAAPAPPAAPPSFEARAQAFGREAEAAATRLAANPDVRAAGDLAARAWGLVLLAVGSWFFARVTLHLPMPDIAWETVWPASLIVLGLFVLVRAGRRS